MSVPNGERLVTKQDLADMYQEILPYLGGKADAGFTPVGTIISVMGVTAPSNYLACNGQVVNIADYPELANYFYQQFGSKNKFGGDGTTTFGIPDLRGEFLRGTGTNSHANQGSGAAVGTHQNATEHVEVRLFGDSGGKARFFVETTNNTAASTWSAQEVNADNTLKQTNRYSYQTESKALTVYTSANDKYRYTSRPTNTSVLYCIATKNIYMNPSLDYSTDEKVVGSYIDGKPIYQKTFTTFKFPSATDGATASSSYIPLGVSIDSVVDISGIRKVSNGAIGPIQFVWMSNGEGMIYHTRVVICDNSNTSNPNTIQLSTNRTGLDSDLVIVTIRYTKTTT